MSYNKVILHGNLTRDVDRRVTPQGAAVASFSLAVNRTYKTSTGELKDEVSYIDCEAFASQADLIAKHFQKGSPILLDGRLKQDTWEKDGEKRHRIKVIVDSFSFVTPKNDTQAQQPTPKTKQTTQPTAEDEVPF